MSALPPEIFRRWIHSHEEDTEEFLVYRPSGYSFPPARGRQAFEIKKDGTFIRYDIAAAEGARKRSGCWKAEARDRIRVEFRGEEPRADSLGIHSCEKGLLKVRR